MSYLKKIIKDRSGATAVEFALLALPFFIMVVGMLQLGIIYIAGQTLDEAIDKASRTVQTGQVQGAGATVNEFRTTVCDNVALVSGCSQNLLLSVQSFPSYASVSAANLYDSNGRPNITNNQFLPGGAGDVVVVSAAVNIPIVAGFIFGGERNGSVQLTSSLVFRNE